MFERCWSQVRFLGRHGRQYVSRRQLEETVLLANLSLSTMQIEIYFIIARFDF